jgi:hypothetical protein
MALPKDWKEFIESLNSRAVEYLIVGGYAVSFHGYPRNTRYIDVFVRPSAENAERVVAALKDFGFSSLGLSVQDFSVPNQIVQLGSEPNRIDLITGIAGVEFEDAWRTKVAANLDGVPTVFIGRA